METTPRPVRTGQILIAALLIGMLTFSVIAVVLPVGTPNPDLANILFVVLGALAVSELGAYHVLVRPMIVGQARRDSQSLDKASRDSLLEQRYLTLVILAGALAEGIGLFGAVVVLVTGRLEALAAPVLAALALLAIIPTEDRLEHFKKQVTEDRPFPR